MVAEAGEGERERERERERDIETVGDSGRERERGKIIVIKSHTQHHKTFFLLLPPLPSSFYLRKVRANSSASRSANAVIPRVNVLLPWAFSLSIYRRFAAGE